MKSTPIKDVEKATAIQPLSERRDTKIMMQTEKFEHLHNYPNGGSGKDPSQSH